MVCFALRGLVWRASKGDLRGIEMLVALNGLVGLFLAFTCCVWSTIEINQELYDIIKRGLTIKMLVSSQS